MKQGSVIDDMKYETRVDSIMEDQKRLSVNPPIYPERIIDRKNMRRSFKEQSSKIRLEL